MSTQNRTEYHYNPDKLIVKTVYADGSSEEAKYDGRQNKIWESDRRGGVIRRSFNESGHVTEETLPNGLVTYYAYDEAGRLIHEWDNGSREQWQQYDSRGNLTEIRRRVEGERMQVFALSYDNMGRITRIQDANNNCTRYVYEGNQANASIVTTPCGNTFRYLYDMAGRCMEVSGEQGTTRYAYNDLDYCTAVTNPAGETTKYYFDLLCNLTKTVLPNQAGPQGSNLGPVYEYDTYDKVIKTTDALGNVFATPRDIDGNIIKEIHPETYDPVTKDGEGIAYEYDLFHHRIKIRYPDGGVERIKYDAAGNIVKKIMPLQYHAETDDGEGWSYVYDEVNRLVEITNPEVKCYNKVVTGVANKIY